MPYSTCCGAFTRWNEYDICPECMEHCDWEEEDDEPSDNKTFNNHNTEGGIRFNNQNNYNGR